MLRSRLLGNCRRRRSGGTSRADGIQPFHANGLQRTAIALDRELEKAIAAYIGERKAARFARDDDPEGA